ncbi:superfamily I DNA/RNA helicase/RecB family exonuclease [Friedmanniella endophytica]|uniref:DNA 3'-5' helicase n=1 Tax=Microlunatus kandeliicorticis TaxID=1759536 RepID=A0A7W3IUU1_9ACTN|nr:ATP-dependent DNA helicase [Microlunatus kandeliicorticis]MBA8795637.1 superfamily I DNA/RNA helicase/RecB family exonuclease [Microlunatus kandeliicorticis]
MVSTGVGAGRTGTAEAGRERGAAAPAYELVRTADVRRPAPELDAAQRAVVAHPSGPLLVLAGPGTGKTTTLVEAVVDRIDRRGLAPDAVLALTFSRRAAADLRTRIAARLGRSTLTPLAMTFHAFCFALLRRFSAVAGEVVPGRPEPDGISRLRLLTAPEQEFRVRETLAGSPEYGRVDWPPSVDRAFPTRGFAAEVRAVLAKTRQLGMDPEDLVDAGLAAGRPEWSAVGQFFDEYLDVLDAEQVLDYAELVHRCRILLSDPEVLATLRAEIGCVFVDEYQDTDPAQVKLLQAIAGQGRDVIAFGDPDQSIYGFRGAEARGILDFPERFPTRSGRPATVLALGTTRRFGREILEATRRIAVRLGMPRSLPAEVFTDFRHPRPDPAAPRGRVEVMTCASAGAEADQIADLLRRAHLHDGLGWDEMAVLVRSGRQTIPALSRALVAAGVPVEVAGDEIPLVAELAVRPLLVALSVAAGRCSDRVPGAAAPSAGGDLTGEQAQLLLTSPLGGLDSLGVRRLGRVLRRAEVELLAGTGLPRPSDELLQRALADPDVLDELPEADLDRPEVVAARALARLLAETAGTIAAGGTAEQALWQLWTGTDWPERLQRRAAGGGDQARRADRDLDAVCALFAIASRSEEVAGLRGVTGFLAEVQAQEIPADPRTESELRGTAVRLLTAHRAKGLEWPLVVVASVQEGSWPDVRRRGSLLEADRLSRTGLAELVPTAQRIAEERRLFYVACTRSRRRLVVSAVEGTEGEGDQPSRFLAELEVPVRRLSGRPARPLTLPALVGELRRISTDPDTVPALREAAAQRLARLADAVDDEGRPLAPGADPARWWGMAELTEVGRPVLAPDVPVQLSGSQLASVLDCPRQWFLARRAAAESSRSTAASFGSVVHVLAEFGADFGTGDDPDRTAARQQVSDHLESVWDQLDFDANWLSDVERIEAESAYERFVAWQEAQTDRTLLGTEVPFACELELDGERMRLTGTADRVERDAAGRIRIVDFKTGRRAPTGAEVAVQDQLGVYQLAVAQGAFRDVTGDDHRCGGAELVYLRLPDGETGLPKVFGQASLEDVPFPHGAPDPADGTAHPTWVHRRLAEAAAVIRSERFVARPGPSCRYCPFRASCPARTEGRMVVA